MTQMIPSSRPPAQQQPPLPADDGMLDNLPPRFRSALRHAGITTLAQVNILPDAALQRIRWIGPETIAQIRGLARHEAVGYRPLLPAERAELQRYAATVAQEIASGTLSTDLQVTTIQGT